MDVVAHGAGGHWIIDVGIYLGPFLSILVVVLVTDRRRRKREEREAVEGVPVEETAATRT
jgi:hypothetical protein